MRNHKNVYFQIGCIQQISSLFTFLEVTVPQPSVEGSYDRNDHIKTKYERQLEYELSTANSNLPPFFHLLREIWLRMARH